MFHYGLIYSWSTNGRRVMITIRDFKRQMLICGPPMEWESPELLQTLTGLYFASVDEEKREGLWRYLTAGSTFPWNVEQNEAP